MDLISYNNLFRIYEAFAGTPLEPEGRYGQCVICKGETPHGIPCPVDYFLSTRNTPTGKILLIDSGYYICEHIFCGEYCCMKFICSNGNKVKYNESKILLQQMMHDIRHDSTGVKFFLSSL